MRKTINHLFAIAATAMLTLSCSKIDTCETANPATDDIHQAVSQVIPPDEAIENLAALMSDIYGGTKSTATLSPDDLQVFGGVSTKSGDVMLPDTSVYVLNFPDSAGYAVMAAQRSMSTPVFCVTESGSLSVAELHQAVSFLEQEYDSSDDDGDADSTFVSVGEKFVPMLLAASAVNQWVLSDTVTAYLYTGPYLKAEYIYRTVTKIGPLLETKWHQDKPFNNFRSDGAPTGCVATATAQILVYNEYGNPGGRVFDWDLMKTICPAGPNYTNTGSPEARQAVSDFMQFVGSRSNCYIRYNDGSYGFADGAKRTFKNFGYKNVKKYLGFEKADKNMEYIERLQKVDSPVILAINKIDLTDQKKLEEIVQMWRELLPKATIIPISAQNKFNVKSILDKILELLPHQHAWYDRDVFTDKSLRFFASEIIREKILLNYQKEIPYCTEVVIENFKEDDDIYRIEAVINVVRESQKGIIIGPKGLALKRVGVQARKDMEKFFEKKVFLKMFVKVDPAWRENKRELKRFGYIQ